jgi:hypothetical protein
VSRPAHQHATVAKVESCEGQGMGTGRGGKPRMTSHNRTYCIIARKAAGLFSGMGISLGRPGCCSSQRSPISIERNTSERTASTALTPCTGSASGPTRNVTSQSSGMRRIDPTASQKGWAQLRCSVWLAARFPTVRPQCHLPPRRRRQKSRRRRAPGAAGSWLQHPPPSPPPPPRGCRGVARCHGASATEANVRGGVGSLKNYL